MSSEQEPDSGRVSFVEAMTFEPGLNLQERLLIAASIVGAFGIGTVLAFRDAAVSFAENGDWEPEKAAIKGLMYGVATLLSLGALTTGTVAFNRGWLTRRDSGTVEAYQRLQASLKKNEGEDLGLKAFYAAFFSSTQAGKGNS